MKRRYGCWKIALWFKSLFWIVLLFHHTSLHAQVHCKVTMFVEPDFCNTNNVILHASAWNFTPPVTFLWSTGETTQDISAPMGSGTYSVTITDAVGCTSNWSVDLNAFNFTYSIDVFNTCSYEQTQLAVNWNQYTIPGNYTYLWSNGGITSVTNISTSGTYSVTITDPDTGCSVVVSIDAQISPSPEPEITSTGSICNGGSVMLTVTGGPYASIYWFPGAWDTETVTVTDPDTYLVTVQNVFGCIGTATIDVPGGGSQPILSGPSTFCPGGNASISVTNASDFTSFNWSNGSNSPTINVSVAGIYSVTVTSPDGCTSIGSFELPGTGWSISGVEMPNTSCANANGSIDVSVTPAGMFTYLWSNGVVTEDLSGLASGTYDVTVTDANSCSSMASFSIGQNTINPVISITTVNATCGQANGNIDVSVSPVGSFVYLWSNGANTEDLNNVLPGTYSVTVTGGNGCSATETAVISNENTSFTVAGTETDNTSCIIPNGSIDVSVTPVGMYTYLWSNGDVSEDLSGLTSGTYDVTVTDANSCSSMASFSIGQNTVNPVISITAVNATCGQANGNVDVSVSPIGSFVYLWSNGANTEDLNNVLPGTYSVTVTGGNGCSATETAVISNDNTSFTVAGTETNNTSCTMPNGGIDVSVTPVGMYTYQWSNGNVTEDLSGLTSGTYDVTVTDANSCSSMASFSVGQNTLNPVISITVVHATCGQANGNIDISVSPIGSFVYLWSNGANTEDLNNVLPGTYSVTVTGGNGCSATETTVIMNDNTSFSVSGTETNNTSCTMPNGRIDVSVTPVGMYTYLWSNGDVSEDLSGLTSGTYDVTVTDANSCSSMASFSVGQNTLNPVISITVVHATCGQANGNVDVSVSPVGSFVYLWSNGANTEDLNNVLPGTYSITVTGGNGCSATETTVIMNDNTSFSVSGTETNNTSCTMPNGRIDVSVTPAGMYTYLWSNGDVTEDLSGLVSGTYDVTVTDANSCSSMASFSVGQNTINPVISITAVNANCGQANGNVDVTVNPVGSFVYLWSNGANMEDLNNVLPGTYSVTVTGGNGCSAMSSVVINNDNASFSVAGTATGNMSCTMPNGGIDVSVTPAGIYTYLWSNGDVTEDISGLTSGTYSVTITDANSCSSVASFSVGQNTINPVISVTAVNANCGRANGNVNVTVNPIGSFVYLWSNGANTEDLNNVLPGTYSVTVTGGNGCSATETAVIMNDNTSFSVSGIETNNTSCTIPNGGIDVSVTPAGMYTYLWSNGDVTEDINGLTAGTYSVTITDANSCSSMASFFVGQNTINPVISITVVNANCGRANGNVDVTVNLIGSFVYLWSNGANTEDLSNVLPGTYSVTVTGGSGCSATAIAVIMNDNMSFTVAGISTGNTSCTDPNGSIDLTVSPAGVYQFVWSNGAITEDLSKLTSGAYEVTVTDNSFCSNTYIFSVAQNAMPPYVELIPHGPDCAGNRGWLEVLTTEAPDAYTYSMDKGVSYFGLEELKNLNAGNYQVIIKSKFGCVSEQSITIPESQIVSMPQIPEIFLKTNESFQIDVILPDLQLNQIDTAFWAPSEGLFFF